MSSLTNQYIAELNTAKQNIHRAIVDKGVTPRGGYASYADAIDSIRVPKIEDDKWVEYVKNGRYIIEASEGFDAFEEVEVFVRVPTQSKTISITENGSQTVTPDSGYGGLSDVKIDVEVTPNLQSKTVSIVESKTHTITPDDNYDGLSDVVVEVDIPNQSKSIAITKNGTRTVTPDSGYNGLSEVEITVNVTGGGGGTGKPKIPNGFQFTGGDIALVDFSQYDWSDVYDLTNFFSGCTHSTGDWSNFEQNFNGRMLCGKDMFLKDGDRTNSFTSLPNMDTSEMIDMSGLFRGCTNLTTLPRIDSSNAIDMSKMFYSCGALESIPQLDTTNVLDMTEMFVSCNNLQTMENLNMTNVIITRSMFSDCMELKSINLPGTQNVRDMSRMFYYCSRLQTVENLNMSSVINAEQMFYYCSALESIPQLNTSKLAKATAMFRGCQKLQTIPQLDLSGVTYCSDMFNGCTSLTSLPDLDLSKCSTMDYIFSNCTNLTTVGVIHCDSLSNVNMFPSTYALNKLTNVGGFRNLGKRSSVSNLTSTSGLMMVMPNLTYESVINVLNELYDRASAGLSVLTLKLHANHMAMLSDEDKAIATNKGWTLT